MPLYIAQSGDLDRCYRCLTDSLTHSLTTLKDSATQLLIKYKSGALVTQYKEKVLIGNSYSVLSTRSEAKFEKVLSTISQAMNIALAKTR